MALKNYILNGPRVVILADGRDPATSWANHVRRSGRGGIDLVAPVNTPVYAPTDGVWRHLPKNGSAGNSGQFDHDDNPGWRDVFSHLNAYVGRSGQRFRQGERIALSGDTAVPGSPHVHRHLLDPAGVRRNPWLYFEVSAPAGGGSTPIVVSRKRDDMRLCFDTGGTGYLVTDDGVLGLSSPQIYNLFHRLITSDQTRNPFVNGSRPETFNKAEMDIMAANIRILTAGANAQVAIDTAKLAAALKSALGSDWVAGVDVDPEVLAAAFAVATPRIAKAVADEAARRLSA